MGKGLKGVALLDLVSKEGINTSLSRIALRALGAGNIIYIIGRMGMANIACSEALSGKNISCFS
jgi:ribosomal protein S25